MAHLWIHRSGIGGSAGEWGLVRLPDDVYQLIDAFPFVKRVKAVAAFARGSWVLRDPCSAAGERWILLTSSGTKTLVNGQQLHLGIRSLADRDEIRLAGDLRLFFSTESLPEIILFSGSRHPLFCPRCTKQVLPSQSVVRCGICHTLVHHPCWLYPGATLTPCCSSPNDLDTGFRWSPEALDYAC